MYWFGGLAKNSRVRHKVLRQNEKRGKSVKLDITDTDRQMFKCPGKVEMWVFSLLTPQRPLYSKAMQDLDRPNKIFILISSDIF